MRHPSAPRRILALAALAAIAAGCGTPPAPSGPPAPRYGPLQAPPRQQQPPEVTEIFPFLADVGLTASQKRALRALLEAQEPPVSQEEAQERGERFLTLLSSRRLNEVALRAFFTTTTEEARQQTLDAVALFADMREVLTAAQRRQAAQALRSAGDEAQEQPPAEQAQEAPQGSRQGQPLDLELSDAQREAFEALQPDADPETGLEALATFFERGDEEALREAMLGTTSVAARVDAQVAAYASLTYSQRQRLVSHMRQQQQQASQPSAGRQAL